MLAAAWVLAAPAARTVYADGDDRTIAEALVSQLDRLAHDVPTKGRITAEALSRAKDALERGTRLRRAGDEAHARTADGLAREWAETGRDLVRATEAESTAADLRRKAMNEEAQVGRARALVEEGIARVGRLRAQIDEANGASTDKTSAGYNNADNKKRAVEVHDEPPKPSKTNGGTP
jgi:hypothetical protein